MAQLPPKEKVEAVVKAYAALSAADRVSFNRAAGVLGVSRATLERYVQNFAPHYRIDVPVQPDFSHFIPTQTHPEPVAEPGLLAVERLTRLLKKADGLTVEELAAQCALTRGQVIDLTDAMRARGINLHDIGGRLSIEREPAPQSTDGNLPIYTSRPDNTYLFGFTSDNHLGSKYERLDVLNNLYEHFSEQGVDRVFNAGNWIDGEARFNKFDLHTHGMDAQLEYLANVYPKRDGIITYAVAGDDHEGWYCQREGVDIGAYAQMKMAQAGRSDWVSLGYMEAFINLRNANSGLDTKLLNCHPGGGSAYAISYTSQKSVEAFEGGERPAVALFGHYHKLAYNLIRNVHCIQTGCTEDQTTFMRKKKIAAHIGGGIAKLTQDPATGAIIACRVEIFNYFNRGYYNGRWSLSGPVTLPERMAA